MIDPTVLERHGLKPDEYERIVQFLGREPNLTELGIFSVMWSEHCSYKSSRVHLRTLPTTGARVLQGPGENAGAVDIGDGLAAVFKIESHNHPSFIEPYQGAATGVGGIIRDIFTMGARPIALLNSLRFGSLDDPRVRRNMEGVVAGIAGYGNSIGIPTVGGEIAFEECYTGNPLVNVFCLGIAKIDEIVKGVASGTGNPVYYVGAKTGRDGIHGATMASAEFDEKSAEKRPAVQVGDPFMEKLLLEACLEVMQTDALVGIQDMGAAGLTCSTTEMGSRGGAGRRDRRVARAAARDRHDALRDHAVGIAGADAARRQARARGGGRADLRQMGSARRAHRRGDRRRHAAREGPRRGRRRDSEPRADRRGAGVSAADGRARLSRRGAAARSRLAATPAPPPATTTRCWRCSGRRRSAASGGSIGSTTTWCAPTRSTCPGLGAGVVRIKGTDRALAMSVDGNGRYCYLDPYRGAMLAVAEAARNVACAGARPLGATNCLNFGNPERPAIMWQFAKAVEGIGAACRALDVPITGGNVSLYNETDGRAIYPTPVIGVVGLLEHADRVVSRRFQAAGRRRSSCSARAAASSAAAST